MARIERLPESVVNRIAAGEVIQRPVNVVKELLENALDAGATQVTVAVKEGGLKSVHVQDNGCGISKADMSLVCERFTTSKLRDFDDLKSIGTHGFRGEALASVSYAGNLTITSKVENSQCAYKTMYSKGLPISPPRACAGNQGTIMLVEDLFSSMSLRRSALRSAAEEFEKIYIMISRYAIHNATVAFLLKKHGEATPIVRTPMNSTTKANVGLIYGHALSEDLIELDAYTDSAMGFTLKVGYLSSTSYQGRKYQFVLFINDRLVDCSALKKAVQMAFSAVLPADFHPFCYLSLNVQPHQLDVNVHPTKREVHFLYEDEIIEKVTQLVETKLHSSTQDRIYHSQAALPPISLSSTPKHLPKTDVEQSASSSAKETTNELKRMQNLQKKAQQSQKAVPSTQDAEKKPAQVIRTSSKEKTLENLMYFWVGKGAKGTQATQAKAETSQLKTENLSQPAQEAENPKPTELDLDQEMAEILKSDRSAPEWRELNLQSVAQLQKRITTESCPALRELIKNHVFIGCFDARLAAVQGGIGLYMLDIEKFTEEIFYQTLLFRLGNMSLTDLEPAPSIEGLYQIHVKWLENEGQQTPSQDCVALLESKSTLLLDYFSLEIKDGVLQAYPTVFDEFDPQLEGLPQLLWEMTNIVNWDKEEDCISDLCRCLARFFSFKARFCEDDGVDAPWRACVPLMFNQAKLRLLPPKSLWEDNAVIKVTDLDALYKVFERC